MHGYLIALYRDFYECLNKVEQFLPYVDNWATSDVLRPKTFEKHTPELEPHVLKFVSSSAPYTVRTGVGFLLSYYLGERFKPRHAEAVIAVNSQNYYVNMMRAWYFATALAKNWEQTIGYIECGRLDEWTRAKTIRKALESHRVSDDKKAYLRSLK